MGLRLFSGTRHRGVSAAAAQGALALLLLLLPVLDGHVEKSLAPVAPGTPIATEGVHPGAATHVESSGTEIAPRCPACDLAQQSAGGLAQSAQPAPIVERAQGVAPTPCTRLSAPLGTAQLRGPPSA